VFALTSAGRDIFSAMTRIAMASLRLTNPLARVTVACDPETDAAVRRASDPILDEVDTWLPLDAPGGTPTFRNRFVRTRLREVIEGPYLYLDGDVLVRGDISEVFALDVDVAAAANHSRTLRHEQISPGDAAILKAMGWEARPDVYLNAGVMYLNDTAAALRFCAEWHSRWLASGSVSPRHVDQPAMNSALAAVMPRLAVLPPRLNAQFRNVVSVARDAVIWHYYDSGLRAPETGFGALARAVAAGTPLDTQRVAALVRRPHPWRHATPMDDFAAARILTRGHFNGWEGHWLNRSVWSAVRQRGVRAIKRLTRAPRG
jgi:hypothetical protein